MCFLVVAGTCDSGSYHPNTMHHVHHMRHVNPYPPRLTKSFMVSDDIGGQGNVTRYNWYVTVVWRRGCSEAKLIGNGVLRVNQLAAVRIRLFSGVRLHALYLIEIATVIQLLLFNISQQQLSKDEVNSKTDDEYGINLHKAKKSPM